MDALTCSTNEDLNNALANSSNSCITLRIPPSRVAHESILNYISNSIFNNKSVMLICADEVVAKNYISLLPQYSNISTDRICLMQDLALKILSDKDVQKATGRECRLIDENENDVLLEDVKVTGLKPKRLREMLKFFYNSIANCADEEDGWIISGEEQQVYNVFIRNLEERKSVLPCELFSITYKGMQECGKGANDFGADIIIVDSFDALSKSAQRLAKSLARETFIAIGSGAKIPSISEPYPNVEGFIEFESLPETESLFFIPEKQDIHANVYTAANPNAEFKVVSENVSKTIEGGAKASDIIIGCPNKIWASKISSKLESDGIKNKIDFGHAKLKGDPRDIESAASIAARAFFRLWLNEDDITALRTWIGIGDWLLHSEAFLELMAHATENNISTLEAMRYLHTNTKEAADKMFFHKIDKRLVELDDVMKAFKSGNKQEINKAFKAHKIALNEEAASLLNSTAKTLSNEELDKIAFAGLGSIIDMPHSLAVNTKDEDAVIITTYKRCIGREVKHLILCGMINGFFPSLRAVDDRYTIDERAKNKASETEFFNYIKSIPSETLTLTLFEEDILENAGKLKMDTTRIFFKDNNRCAKIAPSIFVEELINNKNNA